MVRIDGLAKLRSEEVAELVRGRAEKLEALREQYRPWNAAFRVDSFRTEKQGLLGFFKAPKNIVVGYVLFGKFHLGDRVALLQGRREMQAQLEDVALNIGGAYPGEAGYENTLCIRQKGIELHPGDLIAKA